MRGAIHFEGVNLQENNEGMPPAKDTKLITALDQRSFFIWRLVTINTLPLLHQSHWPVCGPFL